MSCPKELKPVDGECPVNFPLKFVDMEGGECCGKKVHRRKREHKSFVPFSDYEKAINSLNGLQSIDLTVDKIATLLFDTDVNTAVNMTERTVTINDFTTFKYMLELYFRNIQPDNWSVMMNEFETWLPGDMWITNQLVYSQTEVSPGVRVADLTSFYSSQGDELINKYIRSGYIVTQDIIDYVTDMPVRFDRINNYCKMFIQKDLSEGDLRDNLEEFLSFFYESFNNACKNAPEVQYDLYVYRGVKNIDHFDGVVDNIYENIGMMSTSISAFTADNFAIDGYLTRIKIPKGYRALFRVTGLYSEEMEIILPDRSKYYITRDWISKISGEYNECVLIS